MLGRVENLMQTWQEIDARRTATGLLLCYLGFAVSWIPYIKYLGEFLIFIGFIYLFLGRQAFTYRHARFIVLSFVFFILAFIAEIFIILSLGLSLFNSKSSVGSTSAAFIGSVIALMVVAFIGIIYQVLGAYELSDKRGKALLVAAFLMEISIAVSAFLFSSGSLQYALQQAIFNNNNSSIFGLEAKSRLLDYAGAIPLILLAIAYYFARSRILDGIIPEDID